LGWEAVLLGAEEVFFRSGSHPVHDRLKEKGSRTMELKELAREYGGANCFGSLFVPPMAD